MVMWKRKPGHKPTADRHLRQHEAELGYRARALDDVEARNWLVVNHLPLVRRMANAFARRGAEYEDLVQEGSLALMRAARTFEPERCICFATYGAYWIRSYMQRHLASLRSYQYAAPASIAYSGGRSRGRASPRQLLQTVSLDQPVSAGSQYPLGDNLAGDASTPEELVGRWQARDQVRRALGTALNDLEDDRGAVVINKRLLSNDPATLAEIGSELHLSREGARLLEQRLVKRMKVVFKNQDCADHHRQEVA